MTEIVQRTLAPKAYVILNNSLLEKNDMTEPGIRPRIFWLVGNDLLLNQAAGVIFSHD